MSWVPAPGVLRRVTIGLLLLLVAACEDVDIEQARDCEKLVAVFALLALVLVLRPSGLLGKADP